MTANRRSVIHIAQIKMLRLTTVKNVGIVGPHWSSREMKCVMDTATQAMPTTN